MFIYDDNYKSYQSKLSQYPLLAKKEEIDLAKKVQCGDLGAKSKFIKHNLRLVCSVSKKYYKFLKNMDIIDIISEGNLGLIRAVEKYNPDLGFRFSTYAVPWIQQSIERGIYDQNNTIRIPTHLRKKMNKLYTIQRVLEKQKITPSIKNIVANSSFTSNEIKDLLNLKNIHMQSIDGNRGNDDEKPKSLLDTISSIKLNSYEEDNFKSKLSKILTLLNDNELSVISMRYGLRGYDPKTLEEVAVEINLTRERIRQIQMSALGKLNVLLKDHDISLQDVA